MFEMQSRISVSLQSHLLQFGIPTCQAAPESFGSQMEKFVHKFIFPLLRRIGTRRQLYRKTQADPILNLSPSYHQAGVWIQGKMYR